MTIYPEGVVSAAEYLSLHPTDVELFTNYTQRSLQITTLITCKRQI